MRFTQSVTRSLAIAGVTAMVTLGIALAQPSKKPFEPQVGQPGKDVIWVPTPQALVEKMLDLTKVSSNDIHYDLGSGDGRTVIAAAKRGAKAFGVEYNPDMVALSQRQCGEGKGQRHAPPSSKATSSRPTSRRPTSSRSICSPA